MGSYAQNVDINLSGAKHFKTLIVEAVYPYSIEGYKPHRLPDLAAVTRSQQTPELTMIEMFASMRNGDWNWNSSLWSPESLKKMNARDAAAGKTAQDWLKQWRKEADRSYRLLNRIEYGKYVLIEFEAKEPSGKLSYRDTMALEKIDGKWYLTQALAADPILTQWNSENRRVQVAPNTLFDK